MKISRLDVYHIKLPLITPWHTSYGTEDYIESILIRAFSGKTNAWVETCPLGQSLYTPETTQSAFYKITEIFGPLIISKDLKSENHIPKVLIQFQGNNFAKAGLEQCWWALTAAHQKTPLHKLICNGESAEIKTRTAFGISPSIDILLEKIGNKVKCGVDDIKLKIKKGWDLDVVKKIRTEFPEINITVDANGGYTLNDLELLKKIDDYNLEMLEQPLAYTDFSGHAALQKELKTPICLDESILTIDDALNAINQKSCKIINLKIGRVGGISQAIKIYDLCSENGLSCIVGSMMESGIGTACNIELATLPNIHHANGITLPSDYHKIDLVRPKIECQKPGLLKVSKKPYIGKAVDENILEEITLIRAVVK